MMVEYATLQLRRETKEALAETRRPGESFDALVRRLLAQARQAEEGAFFDELEAEFADRKAFRPLR